MIGNICSKIITMEKTFKQCVKKESIWAIYISIVGFKWVLTLHKNPYKVYLMSEVVLEHWFVITPNVHLGLPNRAFISPKILSTSGIDYRIILCIWIISWWIVKLFCRTIEKNIRKHGREYICVNGHNVFMTISADIMLQKC